MKKNVLILIIAGALLGLVWLMDQPDTPQNSSATNTEKPLLVGENAIYVSEQKPGKSVMIEFASLTGQGFVVIHETETGGPGRILGASTVLAAGKTSQGVSVSLSRATKNLEDLFAILYGDNGDGVFSPANDPLILENNVPVMMEFPVDENASEPGEIKL